MNAVIAQERIADHAVVSGERWIAERKALLAREKGADAPAGPGRARAPRFAVGEHRPGLRLRCAGRTAHAGRSFRGPAPVAGAALHARARLGAGLPELLLHGRSHRRHDRAPGAARHNLLAVSRAPLAEIERFRRRMGWRFQWVSSQGSTFNYDFDVSFTPEQQAKGEIYYNYDMRPFAAEEMPGISVFYKDDAGGVFHTYSTYGRGVEVMMGAYRMMDLTPQGRGERDVPHKMEWVRHHDRYEPAPVPKASAAAVSCCHPKT